MSKFSDWKNELRVIVREKMNSELSEIEDLDTEVMKNYWREGYPPQEFFKDHVSTCIPEDHDTDFDVRFDL